MGACEVHSPARDPPAHGGRVSRLLDSSMDIPKFVLR